MAKKKKRKQADDEQKFQLPIEIHGIIFIILAILGFGPGKPLGFIGRLVRSFATFLFGTWDIVFILILLILGCYLIYKKEYPSLSNRKLIGCYIFFIGILVYSHLEYVKLNDGDIGLIFQETLNDLMEILNAIMNGNSFKTLGGGMLGCILATLFKFLFDYQGTYIISIIIMILGVCLFTGISIFDYFRRGLDKSKEIMHHEKTDKEENVENTEEELDTEQTDAKEEVPVNLDERVIITSIDEAKEATNLRLAEQEKRNKEEEEERIIEEEKQALTDTSSYVLPPIDRVLNRIPRNKKNNNEVNAQVIGEQLLLVLSEFNIEGATISDIHIGPSVTQYEISIKAGTKLSKIVSINKEISLALGKKDVRIQAPIPGKKTVGIEVANDSIQSVPFREAFEKIPNDKENSKLLAVLGKNIMGELKTFEINKTPHLLVAGSTGSGKSVCINCIIASILMRTKPDEVKLVLVDPKKVELSNYNGVPHLLMPVVTDPKKANVALQKIVQKMEDRYNEFEVKKVKNIATYNEWVEKENKNRSDNDKIKKMPYIVVIIDELADLMMVASKEVEDSIMRITQMARAAGIHLIVATQRPSTDVITGVVKANIPSRISFAVSSSIDSRTILDMSGAEKLLGKGDMLFLPMGENAPERIQGSFVSDEELERIINWTVQQQKAQYDESMMNLQEAAAKEGNAGGHPGGEPEEYDDPLYGEVVDFVVEGRKASTSLIQRRFRVGYSRAARIVDLLEERGVIGPQNGSKPREVLIGKDDNKTTDTDEDE